jgi:hypothetical protein
MGVSLWTGGWFEISALVGMKGRRIREESRFIHATEIDPVCKQVTQGPWLAG